MVTGLLSHLLGGAYPRPADANNAYPFGIECCAGGNPSNASTPCTGCTGRFAAFMGIGTTGVAPEPGSVSGDAGAGSREVLQVASAPRYRGRSRLRP